MLLSLTKSMRLFYVFLSVILYFTLYNPSGTTPSSYALQAPDEIVVLAAASLKDAFREVGNLYEERTGIKVYFNFSASGILQKQIETGAPADVFASAGEKQMDVLEGKGLIDRQTRSDFVRNTLVLVVPADSELNVHSFDDLDNPKLKRLAVGNPKTVPAGQYAQQLLTNMKLWQKLQPKLILAEDVRQVLDYVARGEVEAGIVYSSDVSIAQGKVSAVANAPEDLHAPILYPIAIIKESRQKESAGRFVDLVLSPEGQSILRKYGFLSVKSTR